MAETSAPTSPKSAARSTATTSTPRVAEWAQESGSAFSGADLAAVFWDAVTSVNIAVRLAHQVEAVLRRLNDATGRPLSIFVNTTLTPTDARRTAVLGNDNRRIFESPVSGGPAGARHGTMSVFLDGPAPTNDEERLLADQAGHVFRFGATGREEPPQVERCTRPPLPR
ncbi:NAD(P)-binding domain-containing protein [Streptomyces hirsutus]|uniref:NAD(P)-binding domain-containing protein n=1 Tax=Streptomyces hirsutus TaxID=35620 RepID=UPI003699A95B